MKIIEILCIKIDILKECKLAIVKTDKTVYGADC